MTATMPPKEEKQQSSSPSPPLSTTSMEEMALADPTPAPALPPGVYFSPTKPESVFNYLDRWITGRPMPDAEGWVIDEADVYGEHPDVLARRYPPASTRNSEPSWWFLCHCKLQPTPGRARTTGAASRGKREVPTVGNWKLEQTRQEVKCAESGQRLGFMRNFGFYIRGKEGQKDKTWWLMEEYTSVLCPEDGFQREDGVKVLPALHRLYITPRDPCKKENKNKKRCWDDCGEGGGGGAPMRPGRVAVPAAYFDAIAALLPPSSVRGVHQEQTNEAEEAPPPPPLPGVSDLYHGYDASSEYDHAMNVHEMHATMPEEGRQGNPTDDREPPQHRDLLPANEGTTAWQMIGRDDDFADSSWIDEHYMKHE